MRIAWILIIALSLAACSPAQTPPAAAATDAAPVEVRTAAATLVREVRAEAPAAIEARHEAALIASRDGSR